MTGATADRSGTGPARRRVLLGAGVVALVAVLTGLPASTTLARYTDTVKPTAKFTVTTLHPPTALSTTPGATMTIAWTPTVDAVADGYTVFRSTTSGSGYGQITTISPASVASTTDTPPASGRYYYVLQTTFQSWTSALSKETSGVFLEPAVTTATVPCAPGSNAAEATGDGDGYETMPDAACDQGVSAASDVNTGTTGHNATCTNTADDREQFWGFALGLPASVYQVTTITVRADALRTTSSGTNNLCVQLSWDGGTSWSTMRSVALTSATTTTYTIGGAVSLWGSHTWTVADFDPAVFRVRIVDATNVATQTYALDYLAVTVTYNP